MARYTIQLRSVIQICGEDTVKGWFTDYELSDYLTDEEIAVIADRGVWSKDKLAQAIIDHYFMYEIGFETPALFAHQAKVLMREIMEEKAPLLYSAALEYDPLLHTTYEETYTGENSATGTTTSTSSSSGLNVQSDTPQGQISKATILAGDYASSTGANENEASGQDDSSSSGTQSYTRTVKGSNGKTPQEMVKEYRKNIVMINRDIIKSMNSLFMGIY
jgi:hypothetical protein